MSSRPGTDGTGLEDQAGPSGVAPGVPPGNTSRESVPGMLSRCAPPLPRGSRSWLVGFVPPDLRHTVILESQPAVALAPMWSIRRFPSMRLVPEVTMPAVTSWEPEGRRMRRATVITNLAVAAIRRSGKDAARC